MFQSCQLVWLKPSRRLLLLLIPTLCLSLILVSYPRSHTFFTTHLPLLSTLPPLLSFKGRIVLPGYSVLAHFAGVATVLDTRNGTSLETGRGRWKSHPLLELIARGREIAVEHQR